VVNQDEGRAATGQLARDDFANLAFASNAGENDGVA
jgi:hypothetical protein